MGRYHFWPALVNCIAPAGFLSLAALLAGLAPQNLLSNSLFGIPSLYVGIALVCFALFAIFRSHFNASVDDRIVWVAILVGGLALIVFFAFLHQSAGLMCTAASCPGTQTVSLTDLRLSQPLGTVAEPWQSAEHNRSGVQIDQSLSSALYYSTVTFTTLGYGDFQPIPRMRLLAGIEALIGYAYLGLTVGLLIDLGNRGRIATR